MSELTETECRAVSIAVDELQSYVETISTMDEDAPKIKWAIRKLDEVLVANGRPDLVSMP